MCMKNTTKAYTTKPSRAKSLWTDDVWRMIYRNCWAEFGFLLSRLLHKAEMMSQMVKKWSRGQASRATKPCIRIILHPHFSFEKCTKRRVESVLGVVWAVIETLKAALLRRHRQHERWRTVAILHLRAISSGGGFLSTSFRGKGGGLARD